MNPWWDMILLACIFTPCFVVFKLDKHQECSVGSSDDQQSGWCWFLLPCGCEFRIYKKSMFIPCLWGEVCRCLHVVSNQTGFLNGLSWVSSLLGCLLYRKRKLILIIFKDCFRVTFTFTCQLMCANQKLNLIIVLGPCA